MKRSLFTLLKPVLLWGIFTGFLLAQETPDFGALFPFHPDSGTYWKFIDKVFEIDQEKITTNRLMEQVLNRTFEFSEFNGKDNRLLQYEELLTLYNEFFMAGRCKGIYNVWEIDSISRELHGETEGAIPITIVLKKYNRFDYSAYEKGWIEIDTTGEFPRIRDLSPPGETPLVEDTFFLAGMFINTLFFNYEENPVIVIDDKSIISDLPVEEIKIKAGAQEFYVSVGTPLELPVRDSYELIVKSGGKTFVSPFQIHVKAQKSSADEVCIFKPPSGTGSGKFRIGIWHSCPSYVPDDGTYDDSVFCNKPSKKLFVVIEGWDPVWMNGLDDIYNWVNDNTNLLNTVRRYGYDVVIIDVKKWRRDLEKLSKGIRFLLQHLIERRLELYGSDYEIVVLGISAGGVLGRAALSLLEKDRDVKTRLLFTWDSPHRGANVPLALQYHVTVGGISIFPSIGNIISLGASLLMAGVLASPSIKEMLIYHWWASIWSSSAKPVNAHNTFYSWLRGINNNGGWPFWTRDVAITNGSITGNLQNFGADDKIFETTWQYYWFIFGFPVKIGKVIRRGFAIGGNNDKVYRKVTTGLASILAFPPFTIVAHNADDLDNMAGGIGFALDYAHKYFKAISFNNTNPFFSYNTASENYAECFIPVKSGLDIADNNVSVNSLFGGSNAIYRDIHYSSNVSFADALIGGESNITHVTKLQNYQAAIEKELMLNILYLQNKEHKYRRDYEARDYVYIGRNVTPIYPQGDVLINLSVDSFKVKAGKQIFVKPGTRIQPQGNAVVRLYIEEMNIGNCKLAKTTSSLAEEKTSAGEQSKERTRRSKETVGIYPNPARQIINVIAPKTIRKIILWDLRGNKVKVINSVNSIQHTLNVNDLAKGMYILQTITSNKTFHNKLVIQ